MSSVLKEADKLNLSLSLSLSMGCWYRVRQHRKLLKDYPWRMVPGSIVCIEDKVGCKKFRNSEIFFCGAPYGRDYGAAWGW